MTHPLTGHTEAIGKIAFSPDGRILASCSDDTTVRLWSQRDAISHVADLTERLRELKDKYDEALQRIAQLEAGESGGREA